MVRAAGVALIENDTYGDLRYEGASLPAVKSEDSILLRDYSELNVEAGSKLIAVPDPLPRSRRRTRAKRIPLKSETEVWFVLIR